MRSVFGESRLENITPIVRLQVEEEYDLCVLKAIRFQMNDHQDGAFEALEDIKDPKTRVMFSILIEHLPLEKESRIAEETFVATYIAPILQGTLRANEKVSIHFPSIVYATQKDQGMCPDRPDIIAKIGGRELFLGEGDNMRLTIKTRGMFLLERVGAFVIPTSVDMLPSLLGTIQILSVTK
ncbi:hypothetical protein BGZ50_006936, partial [Haplosporangium sp. Z 11]